MLLILKFLYNFISNTLLEWFNINKMEANQEHLRCLLMVKYKKPLESRPTRLYVFKIHILGICIQNSYPGCGTAF